jgi:hypothetical protein
MDVAGHVYRESKVGSTRRDLDAWIQTMPHPRMIAMEATIFTEWIYDHLHPHAEKVKVAQLDARPQLASVQTDICHLRLVTKATARRGGLVGCWECQEGSYVQNDCAGHMGARNWTDAPESTVAGARVPLSFGLEGRLRDRRGLAGLRAGGHRVPSGVDGRAGAGRVLQFDLIRRLSASGGEGRRRPSHGNQSDR